ncbi:Na+/H+ antiporter subunit A [Corynebacterium casei]|uniref:Na+/H+ antiporter subunit A n=1 Tax=Corynebacterium casei TaxID=160386 RepID=UPI0018680BA2|nr:Na+/H+ antiporter subunit A [Corynebacterium casei]
MLILLLALIAATVCAPFLIHTLGRPAFGILALVPAGGFIWVVQQMVSGNLDHKASIEWMPAAHLNLDFQLDGLSALFSLIILGVGALVLLYCWGYFDTVPLRLTLFGAQMTGFATAMYGLVISDSLLLMYVFWEITSVLSFLLVAYYGERASSRRSATQALMITAAGGLAMLVGIIILGRQTGVWHFSEIATYDGWAQTPYITVALCLILAGALSKSANIPLHFWLPGAMAAPTPVSAYLHSAAMVKAGIYLVARLAPEFNEVSSWHLVVIPIGLMTMLLGGWMALKQIDLKLVLAYGTVSQLGFIIGVMAIGSREAMMAALALTFAHSLFKATLFMIVGAIDHATGTREIPKLSGLARKEPLVFVLAIISALSMAGIPPLFGFVTKEAIIEAVMHEDLLIGMPRSLMLVAIIIGSVLTMAYALRFLWGAFGTKNGETSGAVEKMHNIEPKLWIAPAIMSALTIFFGLFPKFMSDAINLHLDQLYGEDGSYLALWHGFNIALGISTVIIIAGCFVHWQRHLLKPFQGEYAALGIADNAYDAMLVGLRNLSLRITANTQRGSLQLNLTTIFVCLILLPTFAIVFGDLTNVRMIVAENAWQFFAAFIIIAAAVAATITHNRLSGVIIVGITGYSLAFIFALHGAPDLALTQLLVETIIMVLFMLVLRKMPPNTEWRGEPRHNRLRAWLAIAVGLLTIILTMFAVNARTEQSISIHMPDLAQEIGHGANAVNVLLVDIRAWDTFGEITVLVIAATGVASLIYRTQSFTRESRRPTLRVTGRRWLAAGVETEQQLNRSLMVDVSTRVLFPSMIALSLYFFFTGHNAPGGGFAGGLVAALALILRYLAGGRAELEEALPIDGGRIMGAGLIFSIAAAIGPMLWGMPPLASAYGSIDIPLVGSVSLPSALVFDLGVYLVVIGLTLHILHSIGGKLDEEEEIRKQRARDRARSLARKNRQRKAKAKAVAAAQTTAGAGTSSADTTGTAEISMPTEVPPHKEEPDPPSQGPTANASPVSKTLNADNTDNAEGKEK